MRYLTSNTIRLKDVMSRTAEIQRHLDVFTEIDIKKDLCNLLVTMFRTEVYTSPDARKLTNQHIDRTSSTCQL